MKVGTSVLDAAQAGPVVGVVVRTVAPDVAVPALIELGRFESITARYGVCPSSQIQALGETEGVVSVGICPEELFPRWEDK